MLKLFKRYNYLVFCSLYGVILMQLKGMSEAEHTILAISLLCVEIAYRLHLWGFLRGHFFENGLPLSVAFSRAFSVAH